MLYRSTGLKLQSNWSLKHESRRYKNIRKRIFRRKTLDGILENNLSSKTAELKKLGQFFEVTVDVEDGPTLTQLKMFGCVRDSFFLKQPERKPSESENTKLHTHPFKQMLSLC